MAIITTTSATPIYTAPGESWAIALNVKNNTSKTITGIKVECLVIGNDLGTDAGTVECGYLLGNKGTFADVSIAAGKSVNMHGYVTPPYSLAANFGQGVRIVPVYVRTVQRYKDGFLGDMDAVLPNVHVLNHRYSPQVRNFFIERAVDGKPNDEGEDVLTTLKLTLSDDTKTDFMRLNLYYAENDMPTEESPFVDLTARIPELLNGVVDSPDLIFNSFSNTSEWNFMLMFGDEYENSGVRTGITKAFANVHLSGEPEGGVCFGGFCKKTVDKDGNPEAKFECYYPAYFYGGIALGGAGDYSLEEQDTGSKWIDGKTIYRKVFTGTVKASKTTDIAINIGFETVIRCDGILSYVNSSGMTVQRSLNFFSSTSLHSRVYTGTSDGGKIQINSTQAGDVHVVLEYTKSTDAATTEVT